jgi:hypothetical protein
VRAAEARRRLTALATDLAVVQRGFVHATANYQAWTGLGYPTQSMAGPSGIGGVARPVENLAVALVEQPERERLATDWSNLDAYVMTAYRALDQAARLVRAATVDAALPGALGCEVCERARLRSGRPHPEAFQPRHARGRCVFCDEFSRRYGVDPAAEITTWHLDHLGARIPYALIRAAHPDAFARVHRRRR